MGHQLRSFALLVLLGATFGCEPTANRSAGNSRDSVLSATESSRDFGEYVVYFNAINTDQLTADIARQYDIVRSKSRALLNVNIHRKNDNGSTSAVTGKVTASAANLNGQFKTMTLQEIRAEDAIYYIGELPITDGEALTYTVEAIPEGETAPLVVRFKKQFFVDE
jgi:hypothetical protein